MKARLVIGILAIWPALCAAGALPSDGRFDLSCVVAGRVVADPHPRDLGTYPSNERSWRYTDYLSFDFKKKLYCPDVVTCAKFGPEPIVVRNGKIILFDENWLRMRIDLRSGRYYDRRTEDGRVDVTKGICRRARFSGLAWHMDKGYLRKGAR